MNQCGEVYDFVNVAGSRAKCLPSHQVFPPKVLYHLESPTRCSIGNQQKRYESASPNASSRPPQQRFCWLPDLDGKLFAGQHGEYRYVFIRYSDQSLLLSHAPNTLIVPNDTLGQTNPIVEVTVHNNVTSGKDLFVYVAGSVDSSGSQSMLQTNGHWAVLNAGGAVAPVQVTLDVGFVVEAGSTTTFALPGRYVNSTRLYAFEGQQMSWEMVSTGSGITTVVQPVINTPGTVPYDNRWGFIELTSNEYEFFVNPSFVDFVSLAIGIAVTDSSGSYHAVPGLMQTIPGSPPPDPGSNATTCANVVEQICAGLTAQGLRDGNAWGDLCVFSGASILRVLSPQAAIQQQIPFVIDSYYSPYIASAWLHYTQRPLYIDTQKPGLGAINDSIVSCQVDPARDALICTNTTTAMPRPQTADVWGCNSGAFAANDTADDTFQAIVPRVCAALTRSTLLAAGGDRQPGPAVSTFYQADITNHYARIVHAHEAVGGYAFAYDDVAVEGEDQDGAIQVSSAKTLDVYVGG